MNGEKPHPDYYSDLGAGEEKRISVCELFPKQISITSSKFCFVLIKYTIMDEGISLSLDNGIHTETVVQLFKGNISNRNVKVEFSPEDMDIMKNPIGI